MKIQASSKPIKIRRFIAIILVILSLICLFWPAIVGAGWESRDEYIQKSEEYEKELKNKSRNEQLTEMKRQFQTFMPRGDAKKAADSYLTLKEFNSRPDHTFWELRTYFAAYVTYLSLTDSYAIGSRATDIQTVYSVFGIVLNVLFFTLLVLGLGAAVTYFFNRSRAAGIVFAAFSLFTTLVLAALLIILKERGSDLTAPGPALFLMPLFAIGACIVYQRDRKIKGVFSGTKAEAAGSAAAADVWNRPGAHPNADSFESAQRPASDRSRGKWTCPHCNSENLNDSAYCDYCGNPKPESKTAGRAFCTNCGAPVEPGVRFCTRCGAPRG